MCSIASRRVRGLVAWVAFNVEGFEVLPPGFFLIEEFEVWARVLDSKSKGSRFCRLGSFKNRTVRCLGARIRFKVEGFEIWSPVVFFKLKGSRFGPVCAIQHRKVRGLVAWIFCKVEGFEILARVFDSMSKGSRFGRLDFLNAEGFAIWTFGRQIEHFLPQTLHDHISSIWHSFQKPSISLFNPLSNRAFPDPDSPGPYFLDLAILPGTTNFVCSLEC